MSSEPDSRGGAVIRLEDVSKVYDRHAGDLRLRDLVPGTVPRPVQPLAAVDRVTLEIERGDAIGVIGPNGSGKTTLLRLMAGVTRATSGRVRVQGRVGAMIELGVGFHPELTGAENLRIASALLGRSRTERRRSEGAIVEFAGIADSMDVPVKRLSLGMQARLAFSTAIHTEADVLLVDEVLAVGDQEFQQRCLERVAELVDAGTALVLVSHEMSLVEHACRRVIHVRAGSVVDDGAARPVIERYLTRAPRDLDLHPDPPIRILGFETPPQVAPGAPIVIDAVLEVRDASGRPRIGVDLSLPTIDPDVVTAAHLADLPIDAPGRYRLHATSTPLRVQNASWRVTLGVVIGDDHRRSDAAQRDVLMSSGDRVAPTQMTFPVTVVVDGPRSDAADEAPGGGGPLAPGDLAVGSSTISVRHASKRYPEHHRRGTAGLALPVPLRRRATRVALDDVSVEVAAGETVGVIGPNGAGKSTLLRAMADLVDLDGGNVVVEGRPAPVLDLGAALQPDLTGRHNVELLDVLLGGPGRIGEERLAAVQALAGLDDAFELPVWQYSTGMRARLAVATAITGDHPSVLIDETLAVGDEEFRRLVLARVAQLAQAGTAIVFVSHELRLVEQICGRVVRLGEGRVVEDGPAATVIDGYGASSWTAGTADASSSVHLGELEVGQRVMPVGGTLELSTDLVVELPTPHARIEVAYRHDPGDRGKPRSVAERQGHGLFRHVLDLPESTLTTLGRHRLRVTIGDNDLAGTFDAVLSVIDERSNEVLAETWRTVQVGFDRPEGFPGPVLELEWTVTPVG